MLTLLGALREEVEGLRKGIVQQKTCGLPSGRLYEGMLGGRHVLLAQTGPGRERAEVAARFLLEHYPVDGMISFGFAGALSPGLAVGDIVLYQKLFSVATGTVGITCYSDAALLSQAVRVLSGEVNLIVGDSLTAERVVSGSREKKALGKMVGAVAVDMESYWVAKVAGSYQIPFLAVRAISDDSEGRLPDFGQFFDARGELSRKAAARYFLSHPRELAMLPAICQDVRRAERSLSRFLAALVHEL
jgi:adenosylhomocysteine nucleosidase